jgi:hypothetical protein
MPELADGGIPGTSEQVVRVVQNEKSAPDSYRALANFQTITQATVLRFVTSVLPIAFPAQLQK